MAIIKNKTATAFKPYLVRVSISNLNIRKGPGTNHSTIGKYTGKGIFTIVEEAEGTGAKKWGLLKTYEEKRNGWISFIPASTNKMFHPEQFEPPKKKR